MQIAFPGQANILFLPLCAKADGSPITAGTVNFYLQALTGANAGKWYRDADDSWQAVEAICGAGTHIGRGHWKVSVSTDAWVDEIQYILYAWEDGDLSIPVDAPVWCNTLEQMQKADRIINTAATPWEIEYQHKETHAVILTQTMKNTDGENITTKANILGELKKA